MISGRIQPAMEETAQEILQAVENIEVQVDGTSGTIVDDKGISYVAKMKKDYSYLGLLEDITRNKPPTSNSVPYIYDVETNCLFYVNGRSVGKINIDTPDTDYSAVIVDAVELNNLSFSLSSKNRIENVIQIYGDLIYVWCSGNYSSQSLQNNIQKIVAINKHTLAVEKVYDVKSIIDPSIPYYHGISGVLVTEKSIIFTTSMNINNSAYACHIYSIDKATGAQISKIQVNLGGINVSWGGCLYIINDRIYTLVGDGANVRLVKFSYNTTTGVLSQVGYTASTMPIGPNNINKYWMFHEGNTLYIGEKIHIVDVDTLTFTSFDTIASTPIQKKDNLLYAINGSAIQELDLNTKTRTTFISLANSILYIVPHYKPLISNEDFELSHYLSYIANIGPLFIGYKYEIMHYLRKAAE